MTITRDISLTFAKLKNNLILSILIELFLRESRERTKNFVGVLAVKRRSLHIDGRF